MASRKARWGDNGDMDRRSSPTFDVPRYLSMMPLFNELDISELGRIAEGCSPRRVQRGDMVFRVGEPCNEFHLAVTVQVKLFAISPTGQEKVIEIISPGQSFAEALMFTDRPYFINAQALTDGLLLSISKDAVLQEIERDPRFALRMLAGMSRRLHGLVRDVEAYSLHSGMERVIGFLLRDCPGADREGSAAGTAPKGYTVCLPVSKATVASRLSLTPEYFSRVLHELESAELITVDKRDIHILDVQRLAGYRPA